MYIMDIQLSVVFRQSVGRSSGESTRFWGWYHTAGEPTSAVLAAVLAGEPACGLHGEWLCSGVEARSGEARLAQFDAW